MDLNLALDVAKKAAVEAGQIIMSFYKTAYEVDMKSNDTPVTQADLEANRLIVDSLKSVFPEMAYLSEELSDDLARLDMDYCWIIDPLDGTKEFIKANDEFAVNIALAYRGEIVLGVVYAPVFDELYYGLKGGGAFLEYPISQRELPKAIRVSDRKTGLKVLKSRSHDNLDYVKRIEAHEALIAKIRRVGSSYKGCLIASGRYDVYYSFGTTSVWDIAPLEVIVTEAGGYFAQGDYTPFDYNQPHTNNPKGFVILNNKDNCFDL